MSATPPDIVILGLSLSSAWGNGHATTYRSLVAGLHEHGCRVLFLERNVPWYADHRDLPDPDFCDLRFYDNLDELASGYGRQIREADAVIVGSYLPDGIAVLDHVLATARGVIAFYDIDTPVTLAKLARGDEEFLELRQIPALDIYFSFAGGQNLDRLEREFGAKRALPLYCSVQADRYQPTGEDKRWDLGYIGTYSSDRQPGLERLLLEPARRLPDRRFLVAGPQYPDIAWPANVERIEHLSPALHASCYSRQRFTLNITRADMIRAGWSPSVRLFEAGACRTPVISDIWPGITELFPDGEAIFLARSSDDVVRMLTETAEADREAVAEAAQARVLREHTGEKRAAQLLRFLKPTAETETLASTYQT
jgi:spore maturation protein CgeB